MSVCRLLEQMGVFIVSRACLNLQRFGFTVSGLLAVLTESLGEPG